MKSTEKLNEPVKAATTQDAAQVAMMDSLTMKTEQRNLSNRRYGNRNNLNLNNQLNNRRIGAGAHNIVINTDLSQVDEASPMKETGA